MIKWFYLLSLSAVLVVLLAGVGSSNTANAETSDQNNQTKNSRNADTSNESVNLKKRMPIPFEIRQSSQDSLPLLVIMSNMERNLAVVQGGIWRGDYQAISNAAKALVNHAKIPDREIQKIRTILGEEGLKNFVAADKQWHGKAKELAQKADEKNMEQITNLTTELIQRCSSCHMKYREPLRNSPKWLER